MNKKLNNKDIEFNKTYWDSFYKNHHKLAPSQFCVCVLTEIDSDVVVVELGSGNGRDAHYFASQGRVTIAIDLSRQAIKNCNEEADARELNHSTFFQGDITDSEYVKTIVNYARDQANEKVLCFYSRFVMHSLDAEQEQKVLDNLSDCMKNGENVYFEFRSKEDSKLKKHYEGHFRRYIDTEKFCGHLTKRGFSIDYVITGKGMAKFREEDPYVSRIIARKDKC